MDLGKTTQKILTNIGNLEIQVSPNDNVRSIMTSPPFQEFDVPTGRVRMLLTVNMHLKDNASISLRFVDGIEQKFQVEDCNFAPMLEAGFQKKSGEALDVQINLKFDRTPVPVKFMHWKLMAPQGPALDGLRLRIPVDLATDTAEVLFSQIERKTGLAKGSCSIAHGDAELARDCQLSERNLSEDTELAVLPRQVVLLRDIHAADQPPVPEQVPPPEQVPAQQEPPEQEQPPQQDPGQQVPAPVDVPTPEQVPAPVNRVKTRVKQARTWSHLRQKHPAVNKGKLTSNRKPKQTYCICRQPKNNKLMIQCRTCMKWFHAECFQITLKQWNQWRKRDPNHKWYCSRGHYPLSELPSDSDSD